MIEQLDLFPEMPAAKPDEIPKPINPNPMVRAFGFGPEGVRCKTCVHCFAKRYNRTFYKCEFRGNTNGPGTDHRVNWPACSKYEREE